MVFLFWFLRWLSKRPGAWRWPRELHAVQSLPRCRVQGAHWDYPVDDVKRRRGAGGRVPASAILGMEEGAHLVVWDEEAQARPVVIRQLSR